MYARQITAELLDVQLSFVSGSGCICPKCKTGRILFYPKVAKCSNVDCSVTIFRNKSDKQLTDKQITELVTTGKTGLIKGFKKQERQKFFDASLAFDGQFNVTFVFPRKERQTEEIRTKIVIFATESFIIDRFIIEIFVVEAPGGTPGVFFKSFSFILVGQVNDLIVYHPVSGQFPLRPKVFPINLIPSPSMTGTIYSVISSSRDASISEVINLPPPMT